MFMAERGITGIPSRTIDRRGDENRREPFLSKNPPGQCPALELDNGLALAEITAIGEYFDEIRQPLNDNNKNILAWCGRMKALSSAAA
jgi:glutathione S-transferase